LFIEIRFVYFFMPIYTKTGDTGSTALFGGKRVLKCEELVDAYGSIDELNSWIGLIVANTKEDHLVKLLKEIQSDLFTIGGHLAGWNGELSPCITRVPQVEVEIDAMEKTLPRLSNFIIPGGTAGASYLHIARSICRRVERQVVKLTLRAGQKNSTISPTDRNIIIQYLNRLSDLLFTLARYINTNEHVGEIVWAGVPGTDKSTKRA
jgi:cob(I)alamin adenosyltransferase